MQGVRGSNPLSSTRNPQVRRGATKGLRHPPRGGWDGAGPADDRHALYRAQLHVRRAASLFHTVQLAHEAGCRVDYTTLGSTHLAYARNLPVV